MPGTVVARSAGVTGPFRQAFGWGGNSSLGAPHDAASEAESMLDVITLQVLSVCWAQILHQRFRDAVLDLIIFRDLRGGSGTPFEVPSSSRWWERRSHIDGALGGTSSKTTSLTVGPLF